MTGRGTPAGARLVDPLAAVIAVAALALLAPLEWSAGTWLGLGPIHAGTVTVVIEGTTALAIAAGRRVALALTMTATSAAAGMWHSTTAAAGGVVDVQRLAVGGTLVLLAVTAMATTHHIRARVRADRDAAAAREDEEARLRSQAERAEQERAQRADQERADQERRDAERAAAAQRSHELEMQRAHAYAEQEAARLALEAERVRAAQEQARAEREQAQAQAETERTRALAEQARARAEREQAAAEQQAREIERLRADREYAGEQYALHGWTTSEVAEMLGVSQSRARALIAEWRARSARV